MTKSKEQKHIGRPTRINEELTTCLCEKIKKGLYFQDAAWLCGIWPEQLSHWLKQGEATKKGTPLWLFHQAIKNAESEAREHQLDKIEEGKPGWPAHAWQLERRFTQDYGRKERIDIKTEGEIKVVSSIPRPQVEKPRVEELTGGKAS